MARSNNPAQSGPILTAALTGTGSAASLFAAQPGYYTDITTLVISGTAADTPTLSDGTNSYKFAIPANGNVTPHFPVPLKATSLNTGWTLNMASTSFAAAQAILLQS